MTAVRKPRVRKPKLKVPKPVPPKPGETLHLKLMNEVWMLHWKVRAARLEVERHRQATADQPQGTRFAWMQTVRRMERDVLWLEQEVSRRAGEVERMGEALSRTPPRRKAL